MGLNIEDTSFSKSASLVNPHKNMVFTAKNETHGTIGLALCYAVKKICDM